MSSWNDYPSGDSPGDYFSSPAAILGLSLPLGQFGAVRVRLHFWLLLSWLFIVASLLNGAPLWTVMLELVLGLACLLAHDFAHRIAAQFLDGRHDEFMLWPAGGMIFPQLPPGDGTMFVGYGAGPLINLILGSAGSAGIYLWFHRLVLPTLNPLAAFDVPAIGGGPLMLQTALAFSLVFFTYFNFSLITINLLPYYWFDGGFIWQSIFGPFIGSYRAVQVTCVAGMILAVPMFFYNLVHPNLLGMVFWVLLFYSAYTKMQQVRISGTGEFDAAIASSAKDSGYGSFKAESRRWRQPNAMRAIARERKERAKIDAILEKVSQKGMHSLSWWEKRTLKKASERQRQNEATNRRG